MPINRTFTVERTIRETISGVSTVEEAVKLSAVVLVPARTVAHGEDGQLTARITPQAVVAVTATWEG